MKSTTFMPGLRTATLVLAGVATMSMTTGATGALTPLADQPISIADVPANVMLALSVEFPTAITRAHQDDGDTFVTTKKYLRYSGQRIWLRVKRWRSATLILSFHCRKASITSRPMR